VYGIGYRGSGSYLFGNPATNRLRIQNANTIRVVSASSRDLAETSRDLAETSRDLERPRRDLERPRRDLERRVCRTCTNIQNPPPGHSHHSTPLRASSPRAFRAQAPPCLVHPHQLARAPPQPHLLHPPRHTRLTHPSPRCCMRPQRCRRKGAAASTCRCRAPRPTSLRSLGVERMETCEKKERRGTEGQTLHER